MKENKFFSRLKRLKRDLSTMTLREKVEHLWTYYKHYLLVVAIAGIIVSVVVTGIINRNKELMLSGCVVNVGIEQRGYDYLSHDYSPKNGYPKTHQDVQLKYVYFEDLNNPASLDANYNAVMSVITLASAQMLDYAIMDERGFETYVGHGFFMDLTELFTDGELEQLKVVYSQHEDEPMYPCAIDISQLAFVRDTVSAQGPVYLVFAANTPRKQACLEIWNHILAWENVKTSNES